MLTKSIARTNKLYCSDCRKSIQKGEEVIFSLTYYNDELKMDSCYCVPCGQDKLDLYEEGYYLAMEVGCK